MRINKTAFLVLFLTSLIPIAGQSSAPVLWYWQKAYPQTAADVTAIEAQINQALSFGYTGVAFWSGTFGLMGSTLHPPNSVGFMQQLVTYAQSKGMQTVGASAAFGYSDDTLSNNPNWAEGQHVTGSQFTVNATKTALVPVNSFGGLTNPGFESGSTGWFSFGDSNMGIDPAVAHSGNASGYIANAAGNARFQQTLSVIPWRQYHGRLWVKTSNFQGSAQVYVTDPSANVINFTANIGQQPTQDWTALEFAFNSRGSSQLSFHFGVWGGSTGTMWVDDALIEETSLIYVLRRSGTPLVVYDPANPHATYQEGSDFDPIVDPLIASGAAYPFNTFYHAPGTVTLPANTSLKPGQTVAIDYYAVQPAQAGGDVGVCLNEPAAQNWLQQNAHAIIAGMPPGMGIFLAYDEMRHMNSCAICKAKKLTPGQMLAAHVNSTYNLYHSLAPSASYYIWSDMFDPFHNAVNNYYFVEGDLAGSWKGLPSNLTIMNWNIWNLTNSLTWFSGLNPQQSTQFKQVIAGYYDTGDGAAAASKEVQQAFGIPGITGIMYTTWGGDYSQLQQFATAAKANWSAYVASIAPVNVTPQIKVSESSAIIARGSGRYSQSIKLTNNGAALTAAAYVLDNLANGVALYEPSGTTSTGLPAGSPYKEVGPIAAGATVTFTIQLTRSGNSPITYTPRILGQGAR